MTRHDAKLRAIATEARNALDRAIVNAHFDPIATAFEIGRAYASIQLAIEVIAADVSTQADIDRLRRKDQNLRVISVVI